MEHFLSQYLRYHKVSASVNLLILLIQISLMITRSVKMLQIVFPLLL